MGNVTNLDDEKWMKEIWDWADKNQIDESVIPRESKELIKLKILHIIDNSDLKEVPESIGNLKSLEDFTLKGTNIIKLPESIGQLSKLKK